MAKIKLQPLEDKVIVQAVEEEDITEGGIVLPQTATKEKSQEGKVVAVGPGKLLENGKRAAMSVKVGDKVVFKKYSPDEIEINEEKYLIISQEDILARIK